MVVGNAVDHHVIHRRTQGRRKALVAQERGLCARFSNQAFGQLVQVTGGHAGFNRRANRRQHLFQQVARFAHFGGLLGVLERNHANAARTFARVVSTAPLLSALRRRPSAW